VAPVIRKPAIAEYQKSSPATNEKALKVLHIMLHKLLPENLLSHWIYYVAESCCRTLPPPRALPQHSPFGRKALRRPQFCAISGDTC